MAWYADDYEAKTGRKPPTYGASVDPPEDDARRLLTLSRSHRDGGEHELRVSLAEYLGHEFLRLQIWSRNATTGAWWPSKSTVSVRLREAQLVADAILAGLRLADRDRDRQAPRTPPGSRRPSQPRPQPDRRQPPLPIRPEDEFDEFN